MQVCLIPRHLSAPSWQSLTLAQCLKGMHVVK